MGNADFQLDAARSKAGTLLTSGFRRCVRNGCACEGAGRIIPAHGMNDAQLVCGKQGGQKLTAGQTKCCHQLTIPSGH